MQAQQTEEQLSFKDYCLILQVHPEADAGMVEAAYWHLAKRYNDASASDSSAKAKLDLLNEAYSVLGSPARREDYLRIRSAILGDGALPVPPPPLPVPPPLAVMERQRSTSPPAVIARQRSTPREYTPPGDRRFTFSLDDLTTPSWQNALTVLATLTAATAALAASLHGLIVLGLLVLAMALCAAPVVNDLPRLSWPFRRHSGPQPRPPSERRTERQD